MRDALREGDSQLFVLFDVPNDRAGMLVNLPAAKRTLQRELHAKGLTPIEPLPLDDTTAVRYQAHHGLFRVIVQWQQLPVPRWSGRVDVVARRQGMAPVTKTPPRGAGEAETASCDPSLLNVTFNGVPARRVWREPDGSVVAEVPYLDRGWRIVDAFLGVRSEDAVTTRQVAESFDEAYVRLFGCRTPPLGVRIENA